MTDSLINERGQRLLKTLVEEYIRGGRPVGSRTLARASGLDLSPATVRNVMADLEDYGLVTAPHTSAGRVPTDRGYRFFVDSLLRVRPLEDEAMNDLRRRIEAGSEQGTHSLIEQTSDLLSGITQLAGLVSIPPRAHARLRRIEFLPLSGRRVLAILVMMDGDVENRIVEVDREYAANELERLANFLNEQCAGLELGSGIRRITEQMKQVRADIDALMLEAIQIAEKAMQTDEEGDYVLAGQTNLMGLQDLDSMDRMKQLFETFNEKRDMLYLLERCERAEGVNLFIGKEAGFEAFGECSVVSTTYRVNDDDLGVLGVIGPTRMPYDRVISVVDATAKILSAALNRQN